MGNCIHCQRAVSWVDDDDADSEDYYRELEAEKNTLISDKEIPSTSVVKIKLTRKQLEEVVKKVAGKDVTIEKVFIDLMGIGELMSVKDLSRHWRPALQSIPEV